MKTSRSFIAIIAATALALTACGDSTEEATTAVSEAVATSVAASNNVAEGLSFEEGFMKAKPAADAPEGRNKTGIFGTFKNDTDKDINIVSFTATINGVDEQPTRFELHEVVDGTMQMKEGGYVVPAGGTHELKPGHDHMMIMDFDPAIEPGTNTVDVKIETADGTFLELKQLPVRTIGSGDESYKGEEKKK